MDDYSLAGTRGHYWIQFDEQPDGRVRARALGPIREGGWVGPVSSVTAETKEDAERLLLEKLENMNA
jgi:hypothetical protein